MYDPAADAQIRAATFDWLSSQVATLGDVLPRRVLEEGFSINGVRVPLLGPQGIFKPRVLQEVPLSLTTAPKGPYDDAFRPDGLLQYRYRGVDPEHPDNRGLRRAMVRRLPLVYFHGVIPGRYVAAWPAYIVSDDPKTLTFSVAIDDPADLKHAFPGRGQASQVLEDRTEVRRYVTSTVRLRLHQRAFRERVLDAYSRQCAFCRLRHSELLDAAHIVPDSHPEGEPAVRNGLALCTLHHAAFDRAFLGLRPDYTIEVRPDILLERDGPTLAHAIQALHQRPIFLPRRETQQPDRALLEIRYEQFRQSFHDRAVA